MDSFVLLAYASLAASRTLLQPLLACQNFILGSEDLFCWYIRKKWFLWTTAAAQSAKNYGDEWGLTWYLWCGIYTSNPRAAAEALSLRISFQGKYILWSWRPSKRQQHNQNFQMEGKPLWTNTGARRNK